MDELNDLSKDGFHQEKRLFGNYELIRRIDMGGMGEVYLAQQRTAFNREVAVKIIREDVSRDPLARARFFREAEVSSHLKHDHILPLFEFGEVEGKLFLVTPYISGGTLAQRLQAGPLSLAEVQQLFTALAQAVAYIHRRGIIHRDLKPNNILLDYVEVSEQIYVRLIDFGIAARQGEEASPPLTPSGHEMGTLAYMAPERLNGIAAPSNDIYSLGVILYQMLTKYLPLGEGIVTNSLPAPLVAVAWRCMAANPEDRYASVTDVLHAFEQSCQELSASTHTLQPTVLSSQAVEPSEPVYVEYAPGAYSPEKSGDLSAPRTEKDETFSKADYAAPTTNIAYARPGMGVDTNVSEKRSFAASAALPVSVLDSKKPALRRPHRRIPLFAIASLSIVVVVFVMVGVVFLAFPLFASASVNIGPQVHTLQDVYTITAQPSQSAIDVANSSIPALVKTVSLSGSLAGQTTGQQCNDFSFFQCQQVVTPDDVANVSAQLQQSLISQLSVEMDSQLQAIQATAIGSKQFTDLSESNTPDIGTVSSTLSVTLTEQGSVEYVNQVDVQQVARLLLARQLGPNTSLVNSTIQIGQPVFEAVSDLGAVTIKVAAAGVEEYHYPSAQIQTMLNHIKGMTLAGARLYLRQQPGVDANSISISIHTVIGTGNTLPYSASQIKIIPINPTILPSATLPVVSTPADTTGSPTPGE
ncbi:MAG TPA: serine/threonine-protein kinase [Ktedonobacteraceae bacterium]|nr:serine/threonine-protein kinase [Ktedonobacteraceae bacterium]